MKKFKKSIVKSLKKVLSDALDENEIDKLIEIPANNGCGDYAFPCFQLAKHYKKNPKDIAEELSKKIELEDIINSVKVIGPYLNFYLNQDYLIKETLEQVRNLKEDYGKNSIGQGKVVVVDYSAPNIGKPLHVGHIRSTILGDSLIKILQFSSYKTHGINYLGDIGLHIGKMIVAYNLWGNHTKIEENPEKELLDLYVRFCNDEKSNPELTKKANETVVKLENKDKDMVELWEMISKLSLKAFDRVYGMLGIHFDETAGQSKFSELGKNIVSSALSKKIAFKDDSGAVIISLKNHNLPDKVVLRADGSAIYSTQDLGAAVYRKENFDFDKMLYVVGAPQQLYFKQLFKTLELLGYEWAKDCKHVPFGLINLKEGKMSTREGNMVYLEELLNKSVGLAKEIIKEKTPNLENKDEVAKIIGIGAVKYMILNVDYTNDIDFSWEKALNFENNSAPYIQYAYARASNILSKLSYEPKKFDINELATEHEVELIKKIAQFPDIVEKSCEHLKPHIVSDYSYGLANLFNKFYKQVRVLGTKEEESRLYLVSCFRTTVKNSLGILGIEAPENM